MARPKRVHCRRCNRHIDECGALSRSYLCEDCGIGATRRNALELNSHSGEAFMRWRARSILAMGGIVPDELKPYV